MRFAFVRREITPATPTELSGFASRAGLATGTLDPLTARLLLVEVAGRRVAILAFDLIGVPEDFRARVAPHLPAGIDLVPCATHTHAGPPVLARSMLGHADPAYADRLVETTVDLLREASAALQPGRIGAIKVPVPGIAHNRRLDDGPVDHNVDAVAFCAEDGALGALWVNFACHPVVLGPDNLRYSADFPGATRSRLEDLLSVPVLYTTGCCGQINTGHKTMDSIRQSGMSKRTPEEAERIGTLLADTVAPSLRGLKGQPAATLAYGETSQTAAFTAIETSMRVRIAHDASQVLANPAASFGEKAMAQIDRDWLTHEHAGTTLTVGALRLGDFTAFFLPGEVFVDQALALQAAVPGALVVGYAYTNPGYIPPLTAIPDGGYEVDIAWRPYGTPGPFSPGTAEALAEAALALV
ncbi:putative Ceramidase [Hyphomicrobiales bacterium]|nr:putative Ceramidase [Hyphomicrobiales bacterium]CAH1673281.1 putative Ceramidase [Hyphomicrobiales bacterium]